jgi:hemerythrin-like domain-containing protein
MLETRRDFLVLGGGAALGALAGCRSTDDVPEKKAKENESAEEDVSPAEDLMREHGALNRVLIIYDDSIARLDGSKDVPMDSLRSCARIVRRFIEDYHEKLEEELVFPRLEKAGKHPELVATLRKQHVVGRKLTDEIERLAVAPTLTADADRKGLRAALAQFVRMYRAHESREDTVVFPAFKATLTRKEYEVLGDQFEEREKKLVGDRGWERTVDEVAELEKAFGLEDLAKFTPS